MYSRIHLRPDETDSSVKNDTERLPIPKIQILAFCRAFAKVRLLRI